MFSLMDIVYNAKILDGKRAVNPAVSPIGRSLRHGSKTGGRSQTRLIEDG